MKLAQFLTVSVMTLSMVGCCCVGQNCVDPCDAYSNGPVIGGGILRFFAMPNNCGTCGQQPYGYDSGCGMGGCGGGGMNSGCSCGCPRRCFLWDFFSGFHSPMHCSSQYGGCCSPCMDGGCGQSYGGCGSPSGCGYGQPFPATMPSNINPVPNAIPDANPNPAPAPPAASPTDEPVPTPAATMRTAPGVPTQTVSYEEFQRLPGTVTSGPGVTNSSPANVLSTVPANALAAAPASPIAAQQRNAVAPRWTGRPLNTMPLPPAPMQNQQAVWIPAKPY